MKKLYITIRAFHKTLTSPFSTRRHFSSSSYSSSSSCASFAIKNVTKSNFESALNDLRSHVRDANFVAVDLEMTGITSAPWRESFEFDRFDIQYLKVKDSADKFAVVQFGVCPFRWDAHNQSFIAHPHNFYVFPRQQIKGDDSSYEFLCQTTSIDFLARYQFDFNTCISEGISYLSRNQEEEALRNLNVRYKDHLSDSSSGWREVVGVKLVKIADILFSERLKNKIREWHDRLLLEGNGELEIDEKSSNASSQKMKTVFFKMHPALDLSGFTSHQLRLIQLVIKNHFKDLVYVSVTGEASSQRQLIVYTDSRSDRDLLLREVKDCLYKESEMKIKEAVGFRQVIDLLVSEKKLIVGHNSFLDIAHIYRKFIGPLPSTAKEYVASVLRYFPFIIDTKVLLNGSSVFQQILKNSSSTSLSKAFALLCPQIASVLKPLGLADKHHVKVEVQVDDKRSLNWNSGAKHEAGYDAFMTGCVFAQACSHLGVDLKFHPPSPNLPHDEKLQEYINLLYLSWINGDIIDLRTGKSKADSSGSKGFKSRYSQIAFSNIVILWGFPSKLKASEIRECFCKAFGSTAVTSIYHLDKTAVFIQFSEEELVSKFLVLKETLERNNDPISVLHPLSKVLEGGQTRAANYEVYKPICSSPISKVFFADQAEAVGIKWNTELFEPDLEKETMEDETGANDNQLLPDSRCETERKQLSTGVDPPSYVKYPADELDSFYSAEAQFTK